MTFHTSMENEYTLVGTEEGGSAGRVKGVRFSSGAELEGDLVVVAVGAVRDPGPASALLRGPAGGVQGLRQTRRNAVEGAHALSYEDTQEAEGSTLVLLSILPK